MILRCRKGLVDQIRPTEASSSAQKQLVLTVCLWLSYQLCFKFENLKNLKIQFQDLYWKDKWPSFFAIFCLPLIVGLIQDPVCVFVRGPH
jgi:hypothetical protein